MARPTRSQRRARRQQQAEQQAVAPRVRARQQAVPPVAAQESEPRREPRQREPRKRGFLNFIAESWAELKKVEWPGQRQVVTGTVVVIVACLIVGGYLWVADLVVKRVVQNVFLGQ